MATTTPRKHISADELWQLPNDGYRYELVRGALLQMSPSNLRSDRTGARIIARLGPFVEQHRLGDYGAGQGGFWLGQEPDTVRAPDVWFVREDRIPAEDFPEGSYWRSYPDLVIEVLSPSERIDDIAERVLDYLAAGTRLMWVVEPRTRAAVVFGPDGLPQFVFEDGALDGEDVLPGFVLPLTVLFRRSRR